MLKVITPPSIEPIGVEDAKRHAVITIDDDDAMVALYISAAREQGELITGRSWAPQTLEVVLDSFPSGRIDLQRGPVNSITSVKYLDSDGAEQTLSAITGYNADTESLVAGVLPIYGGAWPVTKNVPSAVRIRYAAGWLAENVPKAIKMWMLLRVAGLYNQRESFVIGAKLADMGRQFYDGLLDAYIIHEAP